MVPALSKQESNNGDELFQMQMELTELRNRIKLLDCGTGRCELLDLLKERDVELKGKNEKLQVLNGKFHQITNGLSQIEAERHTLRTSVASLENEKKKVQRYLNIREKEVMSLVKRVADQEEKLQETVSLRVSYRSLEDENKTIRGQLGQIEEEMKGLAAVRRELSECEAARIEALDKIKQLEEQHKRTSDGLLGIIAKLQKTQLESDRNSEDMHLEMEKIRIDREIDRKESAHTVKNLTQELRRCEERLMQLQDNLQGSEREVFVLQSDKASMKESHAKLLSQLKADHTQQQGDLIRKHEGLIENGRKEYEAKLDKLQTEIGERDVSFKELIEVTCRQEDKIGSIQTQLGEGQRNSEERMRNHKIDVEGLQQQIKNISGELEVKMSELRSFELSMTDAQKRIEATTNERDKLKLSMSEQHETNMDLLDQLKARDADTTSLKADLYEKQDYISILSNEKDEVCVRLRELELQLSSALELEEDLNESNSLVEELQNRLAVTEEEMSQKITKLQADLQNLHASKTESVNDLNVELKALETKKIAREEHLGTQLEESQSVIRTLKSDLILREKALKEGRAKASKAKEVAEANREEIESLKQDLESASSVIVEKDDKIKLLQRSSRNEIEEKMKEVDVLRTQIGTARGTILKQEEEINAAKSDFQKEVNENQMSVKQLQGALDQANELNTSSLEVISELKLVKLKLANDKILFLESEVSKLNEKVSSTEIEFTATKSVIQKELDTNKMSVKQLQGALHQANGIISRSEEEINELKLVTLKAANEMASSLESEVSKLNEILSSAETEFDAAKSGLQKELDAKKTSFRELQGALHQANEIISRFEKENNELKLVTLKAANEKALFLESEVTRLNKKLSSTEMEAAEIVADLEESIEHKHSRCESFKENMVEMGRDHEQMMSKLNKELDSAALDKTNMEDELQSQRTKMREKIAAFVTLEKLKVEQDKKINSLRAELDLLRSAQEKMKKEHTSVVDGLQLEINMQQGRSDSVEGEMEEMSEKLIAAEGKFNAQVEAFQKIQVALNERTKLLGDMVTQNKIFERDLQEARTITADLQKESEKYMLEKDATDAAIIKLKEDLDKREEQFLTNLHKERQYREKIVHDYILMNKALQVAKKDEKEYEELEKENNILKDKVKRQEAYLKRKLEKEKMLKDRIMTSSTKGNVVPPRAPSPTKKRLSMPQTLERGLPELRVRASSRSRASDIRPRSSPRPRPSDRGSPENCPSTKPRSFSRPRASVNGVSENRPSLRSLSFPRQRVSELDGPDPVKSKVTDELDDILEDIL